jgi:hypothetical protein
MEQVPPTQAAELAPYSGELTLSLTQPLQLICITLHTWRELRLDSHAWQITCYLPPWEPSTLGGKPNHCAQSPGHPTPKISTTSFLLEALDADNHEVFVVFELPATNSNVICCTYYYMSPGQSFPHHHPIQTSDRIQQPPLPSKFRLLPFQLSVRCTRPRSRI